MPFYRCYVPADSVPFDKRQEVAKAFTDIHCGSTGAPRSFVQVAFFNSAEADYPTPYYIDGGNRAGRPVEVREKLLADLKGAFVDITGVSADQLGGRITEGRASWSMEGGHVLPEPGEEGPEWFQHAAAD
jgi:phenylpyruvate tautomerase PptA (4-oxalocrotonate tautomerase family)